MSRFICWLIGHDYPPLRPDWIDGGYCWQCRRCHKVTHGKISSRWD